MGHRERALYWARCFGPCAVRAPVHSNLAFCGITPFLSLKTTELPRNHYNSPSGFDPVLRCYTSPGRTSLDGRLRSWGYHIILHFSLFSLFLPIHAPCLSRHHTPSYNMSSLCAPAALTITSWVARPPGAHHKQQQAHITLLLTHIFAMFLL